MLNTTLALTGSANGNGAVRPSHATIDGDIAHMSQDPIRIGEIIDIAAAAARRSMPGPQKRYMQVAHVSRSRASRHLSGDDPYSPAARMFVLVDAIARSDYGTAFPLISEQLRIVMAALQDRPPEELRRQLAELRRQRIDREAVLRHAEHEEFAAVQARHDAVAAVDAARMQLLETDFAIAAIRRVLEKEDR